jgi:hypothetical protein
MFLKNIRQQGADVNDAAEGLETGAFIDTLCSIRRAAGDQKGPPFVKKTTIN